MRDFRKGSDLADLPSTNVRQMYPESCQSYCNAELFWTLA